MTKKNVWADQAAVVCAGAMLSYVLTYMGDTKGCNLALNIDPVFDHAVVGCSYSRSSQVIENCALLVRPESFNTLK